MGRRQEERGEDRGEEMEGRGRRLEDMVSNCFLQTGDKPRPLVAFMEMLLCTSLPETSVRGEFSAFVLMNSSRQMFHMPSISLATLSCSVVNTNSPVDLSLPLKVTNMGNSNDMPDMLIATKGPTWS